MESFAEKLRAFSSVWHPCSSASRFGFWVLSDSSAARAVTARTGSGRVKHVEARYLWVQDRVRKKQFSLGSIDTSHNTADLGTKFHSGERLRELMRMMPIVVGEF